MNNKTEAHVLVIDDEPDLRALYELTLLREGYVVDTAEDVAEALSLLESQRYEAVITDMRLPDGSGLDVLTWLDEQGRPERALVITAHGSAENAVEALKAGAYDYLTKPVDLKQFRMVVASALGRGLPAQAAPAPGAAAPAPATRKPVQRGPESALTRLIGDSAPMQQVRELIQKVARSMAPVLLHGESGTGKELVARSIHEVSSRTGQAFVAVNCGAIPEQLLEAEFFGYRKGAFTGAQEDREGFFQAAHQGTLFLDEIGDLPLAMQSKLLRALQERSVRPVGAVTESPVNVRLVSASHKDLAAEVAAGRFRQDLYYRLNVICIRVPPLRERMDDLPLLCDWVLRRIAQDAGVHPVPRLSPAAQAQLQSYAFPGNVRELENLLHRALALVASDVIGAEDLGLPAAGSMDAADGDAETLLAEAESSAATAADSAADVPRVAAVIPSDLVTHLDMVERQILLQALETYRYNRTAAGAAMGLTLRQMRYRMARLGITVDDDH
ncbi:sigma-54-dependent transcriptional regulator [Roseateles sp. BYS180W]|uniref:Sigma-54-dependent transcriptional regulator n=1 Tax=Roseateles rivi TaxID=3299028 RepID=A0ABW7FW94_9BURK